MNDMRCEQHPEQLWPHDDCIGPGMPARLSDGEPSRMSGVVNGVTVDRIEAALHVCYDAWNTKELAPTAIRNMALTLHAALAEPRT